MLLSTNYTHLHTKFAHVYVLVAVLCCEFWLSMFCYPNRVALGVDVQEFQRIFQETLLNHQPIIDEVSS